MSVIIWQDKIEAIRGGRRIFLSDPWNTWLVELLGRPPETFEEVERAWNVFPKIYADSVERLKQVVLLEPEGTEARAIAERVFFGTNGLGIPPQEGGCGLCGFVRCGCPR